MTNMHFVGRAEGVLNVIATFLACVSPIVTQHSGSFTAPLAVHEGTPVLPVKSCWSNMISHG